MSVPRPARAGSVPGSHRRGALAVALAVALVVGYPLVDLLRATLVGQGGAGPGAAWRAVTSRGVVVALAHTLAVSAVTTALAVVLGTAMALLVERSDLPLRRLLRLAFAAPLLLPAYVTGLAWLDAYARAGLSDDALGLQFGGLTGPLGLVVLLVVQGYPLAYLLVRSALSNQRAADLEDAARSAGSPPLRVLLGISLPLVRQAVVVSALLVFVATASDFGIPAVVAIPAGFSMVTTLIYSDLSFAGGAGAIGSAAALSALLGLMALILILGANRLNLRRHPAGGPASRRTGGHPILALGRARHLVALVALAFVALTVAVPLVGLFLESVSRGFRLSASPAAWTLAQYRAALSGANFAALGRSVLLAGAAAVVVSVGGGLVAVVLRGGGRLAGLLGVLTALPFALPGSVVAIAVLIAWQRFLYGTLLIILIAYVARFAVLGVRSAGAALSALPDEHLEAARASGASPHRVLLDVVAPVLLPGVLVAFALVFLLGVHELTMSSLLFGPTTKTFAVQVLAAEEAGELGLTAALAVVVTAITAVVAAAVLATPAGRRLVALEVGA